MTANRHKQASNNLPLCDHFVYMDTAKTRDGVRVKLSINHLTCVIPVFSLAQVATEHQMSFALSFSCLFPVAVTRLTPLSSGCSWGSRLGLEAWGTLSLTINRTRVIQGYLGRSALTLCKDLPSERQAPYSTLSSDPCEAIALLEFQCDFPCSHSLCYREFFGT